MSLAYPRQPPPTNSMSASEPQRMPSEAIPSHQRVEPGSVNLPVADLSQINAVKPEEIDQATEQWVSSFNKIIELTHHCDSTIMTLF